MRLTEPCAVDARAPARALGHAPGSPAVPDITTRSEPEQAGAKRAFIHRLFTTIAPRYDWFNRLASLGLDQRWRRRAIALGAVSPGMEILDVCTGTGDLALLCAAHLWGDGQVIGLDCNHTMLQAAARKQAAASPPMWWVQADAQVLPFPSGRFDRVFIGFSTRNLSDLQRGILEMARVLKANGKLIVLETGRPANRLLRWGYFLFLATGARLIGVLLTGRLWPFTYLARSVQRFLHPEEFVGLLQTCGLRASYLPLSYGLASLYVADKPAAR